MFKAVLFALLAANAASFAFAGSASKALDACAWLLLLVLFEAETRFAVPLARGGRRLALRALRLAAAAGVIAATVGYIFENNALDAANSLLWIAMVVLLEVEVRRPHLAQRAQRTLSVIALSLYAGLALLVFMWAWRGDWFDAYDALLWLFAFATLELGVRAKAPIAADAMAR
ncbi:MAG TPA: hypothetical protein VM164_02860 [Burkholderiales bacterium]|nr:hypothetical protein [Burkholderiales bacterium]